MDILDTDAYDRKQRRNTSCILFLFLLPFFASTAAYFYLWIPESNPSIVAAAIKSAPLLSLALVVLSYSGGWSLLGVAGGLVMSAGGDSCLIWPETFLHGMAFFAVAHLLYSVSFISSRYSSHSSSSLAIYLFYVILWGTSGGIYVYILPSLHKAPDPVILVPAVGVYSILIALMATLAARTRQPLVIMGSLLFIASDCTLALQHFKVVESLQHGRHVVMTLYYLAQFFIAVGDVKAKQAEDADENRKWKRS